MGVSFQFDNVRIGSGSLFLIAGPCVIESEDHAIRMAEIIKGVTRSLNLPFIFKASYDKANRTSLKSFRGPGLKEGLRILRKVKDEVRVPILTDVHEVADVASVAEVADILQIPAFLCRQTDLLRAAAETGRAVNVKKGQFLAPWDVRNIAEKLIAFRNEQFCFTERGTSFGYNNLVADMRSLYWLRDAGYRVIFDATHSVQRPGGAGDSTSGDGVLAPALARAAMATGCDGIFMEVHENPARALSDGPNQIPLKDLPKHLRMLKAIHAAVSGRGD